MMNPKPTCQEKKQSTKGMLWAKICDWPCNPKQRPWKPKAGIQAYINTQITSLIKNLTILLVIWTTTTKKKRTKAMTRLKELWIIPIFQIMLPSIFEFHRNIAKAWWRRVRVGSLVLNLGMYNTSNGSAHTKLSQCVTPKNLVLINNIF